MKGGSERFLAGCLARHPGLSRPRGDIGLRNAAAQRLHAAMGGSMPEITHVGWESLSARCTAILTSLADLADDAGALELAFQARLRAERLAAGRFLVGCVGQSKRGKSTLLNALLGTQILPTGVAPATARVTLVRHGDRDSARVRIAGEWHAIDPRSLSSYVLEGKNPDNHLGVTEVEVSVPSPLLARGLCLVDTPGVGSIYLESVGATLGCAPHLDAAIVVLGADPPITGEELSLVEEIARDVEHLVFVMNKVDRVSDLERREAVRFTEAALTRVLRRPPGPIVQVSCVDRLGGAGPGPDWSVLERRLGGLAALAGRDDVRPAVHRGIEAIVRTLGRHLDAPQAPEPAIEGSSREPITPTRDGIDRNLSLRLRLDAIRADLPRP
jgi:GTP-binding protein EngB required for normal cell division